jgi:hypothetical protein
MRHTHYPAFTYVPLTNIKPIACPRCKRYVHLIERAPLPAGLKGEMRTFECKKCGKQKIIVQDKAATGRHGDPTRTLAIILGSEI